MADPQGRIFISYRREDSAGHVLALLPALRRQFGDRVFKDTDNIPPGEDFVRFIKRELDSCSVLLAIIGRDWLTVQDPRLKTRRLDNPDDFLRIEVSTALRSERIRVIPVLVERSTMPSAADLPDDLAELPHRNAFELSDTRWESDVQLLIQAIQRAFAATVEPTEVPLPHPELQNLEKRRAREITGHLAAAQEAFDAQEYEATLLSCEKALLLDSRGTEALELLRRAQKAIDERAIDTWLKEARQSLHQGDTGGASDFIDRALSIDPASEIALALRKEMLAVRREQERGRERVRAVSAVIQRARASLDDGDFDGAVRHADDALALEPQSADAQEVRSRAVAALDERRRQREARRRAQQTVTDPREERRAGAGQPALLPLGPEREQRAREGRPAQETEARGRAEAPRVAGGQRQAEPHAREHAEAEPDRELASETGEHAVPALWSMRRYGAALGVAVAVAFIAAIGLWQYQQPSEPTSTPPQTNQSSGTSAPARTTEPSPTVGASARGTSPGTGPTVATQPKTEGRLGRTSAAPTPPKSPDPGPGRASSGRSARGASPGTVPAVTALPNEERKVEGSTEAASRAADIKSLIYQAYGQGLQLAVADVVQRYVKAVNARNVAAVKEVYPTFTDDLRSPSKCESYFQLKDLSITVSPEGTSASVGAGRTDYSKCPGGGEVIEATARASLSLQKQGDAWIIVSVRYYNWRA